MRLNILLILFVALQVVHIAVVEIPVKPHGQILAKTPQVDADVDSTVTMAELKKAFPDLPKK